MPEPSKQEINLFYCYAREDKALRDELEKHLSSLKRLYALRNWHDREILPGEEWEKVIDTHLNTAHLILLLVSPDFMNSDYCYGKEMQRALGRHEEGSCRVIPIILRPTCLEAAPFLKLQMLPTDAKPITRWHDRDEAFHDVVREISLVLKDLLVSLKTKKDWLDEGISFRKLKRYDYALDAFEQALHLDPNYLEAYQEKGMTFLELERYEEALAAFEQAIHLDPNHASVYIGRDKALQQLGISREAQEQLASQLVQTQRQQDEALEQLSIAKKAQEQLRGQLQQTQRQQDETREKLGILKKALEELTSQLEKPRQRLASDEFNALDTLVYEICISRQLWEVRSEWVRIKEDSQKLEATTYKLLELEQQFQEVDKNAQKLSEPPLPGWLADLLSGSLKNNKSSREEE